MWFGCSYGGYYPYGCYPWGYYGWGCWPYSSWWWGSYGYPYYGYGYGCAYGYSTYWPTSVVIYDDSSPTTYAAAEEAPAYGESVVGEGVIDDKSDPGTRVVDDSMDRLLSPSAAAASRTATQNLSLGDSAFREGRYGDAVHFYARAIEFQPDEGVLYLVLSDALFATGDYHYGAYALRKALELDPTLLKDPIDKHGFYADPKEFDRQLGVLETYLKDRPTDQDARLLLAANYLFGRRPAAAVDLLESSAGESLRASQSGGLLLEAARKQQFSAATELPVK